MANPVADLIRAQLGITPKALEQLSGQIEKLDLDEAETLRVAAAVNAELARIYAERHVGETAHRVKHDVVETAEEVDDWSGGTLRQVKRIARRNQRDDCPDCGRTLVAARDDDSKVPILVCPRLHGLSIAETGILGLTPNDIVACGG